MREQSAQLVEFGIHPFGNGITLIEHCRRVGVQRGAQTARQLRERVNAIDGFQQRFASQSLQQTPQRVESLQSLQQTHHFARTNTQSPYLGGYALRVADFGQYSAEVIAQFLVVVENLHHLQPLVNLFYAC